MARQLLCDLTDMGIPVALELLDTISPQYLAVRRFCHLSGRRNVPTRRRISSVGEQSVRGRPSRNSTASLPLACPSRLGSRTARTDPCKSLLTPCVQRLTLTRSWYDDTMFTRRLRLGADDGDRRASPSRDSPPSSRRGATPMCMSSSAAPARARTTPQSTFRLPRHPSRSLVQRPTHPSWLIAAVRSALSLVLPLQPLMSLPRRQFVERLQEPAEGLGQHLRAACCR